MNARGAVLSKAPREATITSTVATRHYGVAARSPWEEEDEGQTKIWDSYKEIYRVRKMTWYINTVRSPVGISQFEYSQLATRARISNARIVFHFHSTAH